MKHTIGINYYDWDDGCYEAHVDCTGTDYMLILCHNENLELEWLIQHIDNHGPYDDTVLDLTTLSEEELFQASVVWDEPLDFYLVQAIQKYVYELQPSWKGDTFYSHGIEY